jgi:hypothetical protein
MTKHLGAKMKIRSNALVIASTAVAYFLLFQINTYLFSAFGYSEGVNWVFLPSGLRVVFILLFGVPGAIGIALSSMAIGYLHYFDGDLVSIIGTGAISGFAPWLARLICVDGLKLDVNLQNLTAAALLKISVIFAVISPLLHQLWFTWRGYTEDFINSTAVMAVGDLVGTIAMLYAAKLLLALVPAIGNNKTRSFRDA